jgi:hypothetical protein
MFHDTINGEVFAFRADLGIRILREGAAHRLSERCPRRFETLTFSMPCICHAWRIRLRQSVEVAFLQFRVVE